MNNSRVLIAPVALVVHTVDAEDIKISSRNSMQKVTLLKEIGADVPVHLPKVNSEAVAVCVVREASVENSEVAIVATSVENSEEAIVATSVENSAANVLAVPALPLQTGNKLVN